MKFECKKTDLLDALNIVMKAVDTKNIAPTLSGILVETQEKSIKLTATNTDISLIVEVAIECDEIISFVVPAQKFLSIIKELSDRIPISITAKDSKSIVIKDANSTFKISCLDVKDYPKINLITTNAVKIPQEKLQAILDKASFAMAQDDSRPLLRSVFFNMLNSELILASTDGKRLAIAKTKVNSEKVMNFVFPAKSVSILENLLSSGDITLTMNPTQVMFATDNIKFISKLLENSYPAYDKVIPKENASKLTIDKEDFISALKKAALFVTQDSLSTAFEIEKDKMTIAKKTEYDNVQSVIKCKYVEELTITFNPLYLIEIASKIDDKVIEIELNGIDKPAAIRKKDEYTFVVLPTKI